LLEHGVGPPGELTMAVDKLLRRPRGRNGAGFLMMKQEFAKIQDFTEYDIVLIYYFIIELLNRTPEIPVDDAVHPDVLANAGKFVGLVPSFLLKKFFLCSDISHKQRLTMATTKITQLDLWTQTTSMATTTFYGPVHQPESVIAHRMQEHALSFFHLCYIVQRRNGFQRKKKKDDGSDDESDVSDDETDASAHEQKPQWFTRGLMGDFFKNQIYFEPTNFEEVYVKPDFEACKTLAEYEVKVGSSAKWAPEFTPGHNARTQCAGPPGAVYPRTSLEQSRRTR
jgi:hypothetical protein